MTVATSLIPGLEEIVRHGDPKRRADAAGRIADLFLRDAARLRPTHVQLFDEILVDLVPFAETIARVEIAERMSHLANAPPSLAGQLAREKEILVAGPILRRSPVLREHVLLEVAGIMGQDHLLAMSERASLSCDLTDIIVHRGDREVVRRTARNAGAAFSDNGYSELVRRAGGDGVLTLTVGQRADLPHARLKELLAGSLDVVRRRLFQLVGPERQAAIKMAMSTVAGAAEGSERDFLPAQRTILALHRAGNFGEAALLNFAKAHRYEESVAALSALSGIAIGMLDQLISGDRHDPILIVGKVAGLEWATVRALILLRLGRDRAPAPADIENARVNFGRLMPSTAERVVGFWKTRQPLF